MGQENLMPSDSPRQSAPDGLLGCAGNSRASVMSISRALADPVFSSSPTHTPTSVPSPFSRAQCAFDMRCSQLRCGEMPTDDAGDVEMAVC